MTSLRAVIIVLVLAAAGLVAYAIAPRVKDSDRIQHPTDSLRVSADTIVSVPVERPEPTEMELWADSVLSTLSLEHRIAQLLVVHMDPAGLMGMRDPLEAVRGYQVSGFIVPRLMAPSEVRRNVRRLQSAASVPLFIAADYERGVGRYNNNFTELPSNMAIGATRDTVLAEAAGRLTAVESRAIGVNLLFAPVVDVNNNPNNPIINTRSYGEDPALVGSLARAFIRGAEAEGVLTTAKHFPGHGNTDTDTHISMAHVPGTRVEIEAVELRPYRMLMEVDPRPAMIMSAHLWMPSIDDEPIPATLSRRAIRELIRTELGYEGVIITDDIHMGGISERFTYEESIVGALEAGVDVVLTPRNVGRAIELIRDALAEGRLSYDEIDASVRRVLLAKANAGLHEDRYPRDAIYQQLAGGAAGEHVADSVAAKAVTVLDAGSIIPLAPGSRIALVQMTTDARAPSIRASMDLVHRRLRSAHQSTNHPLIGTPQRREADNAVQAVANADVAVVLLYMRVQAWRRTAQLDPGHEQLMRRIIGTGKPVIFVTMGNPYVATHFTGVESLVIAYDHTLATVRSVTDILDGRIRPRGRLPITVGRFHYGDGIVP